MTPISFKLKKLNRDLLRKRIMAIKHQPKPRELISSEDIFNLDMALKACDTFEELYEFIEII